MVAKKDMTVDDVVGSPVDETSSPKEETPRENNQTNNSAMQNGYNFDGVVDNRVIPDAGVPTQYMEGILDVSVEGHGYLRPSFSPSNHDVYILLHKSAVLT
jgi:transcription termination factor Rho